MLNIVRIAGHTASGKSTALRLIELGMCASTQPVEIYSIDDIAKDIAQAFYAAPHTILIDDCTEQLLDNLRFELAGCDAYIIAAMAY